MCDPVCVYVSVFMCVCVYLFFQIRNQLFSMKILLNEKADASELSALIKQKFQIEAVSCSS